MAIYSYKNNRIDMFGVKYYYSYAAVIIKNADVPQSGNISMITIIIYECYFLFWLLEIYIVRILVGAFFRLRFDCLNSSHTLRNPSYEIVASLSPFPECNSSLFHY